MKRLLILLVLCIPTLVYSDVVLTDKEYMIVRERLLQDKAIIQLYTTRYTQLRKETPKVEYVVKENKEVEQTIIIPVYKDNPLIYKIIFRINEPVINEDIFPFKFFLYTGIEYGKQWTDCFDIKVGLKLISMNSSVFPIIKPFGFNALLGSKSSGISISYTFTKVLTNTSLHLYGGVAYNTSFEKTAGIGLSIYF